MTRKKLRLLKHNRYFKHKFIKAYMLSSLIYMCWYRLIYYNGIYYKTVLTFFRVSVMWL